MPGAEGPKPRPDAIQAGLSHVWKPMHLNYEDAAWLWLDSKPWAVTPELLFHAKQLIMDEASQLKGLRAAEFVWSLDRMPTIAELEDHGSAFNE